MPTYNMPKSNETLEEMLRNLTTKVEEGFEVYTKDKTTPMEKCQLTQNTE